MLAPASLIRLGLLRLWPILVLIVSGASDPAAAASGYDDPREAEGWAFALIKRGETADFNRRCKSNTPADPKADDPANAAAFLQDCRKLAPSFVVDILTRAPWRDQIPIGGVAIVGAHVTGDIVLANASLNRALSIRQSLIDGAVIFDNARTDSMLSFRQSHVLGRLSAFQLQAQQSLDFFATAFEDELVFSYAKIDGYLLLETATVKKKTSGTRAKIATFLHMNQGARFEQIDLRNAAIGGELDLRKSTFDGEVDARFLRSASIFLCDSTFAKLVDLSSASIAGDLELLGASLAGLSVQSASISGEMQFISEESNAKPTNWAKDAELNLMDAKIGSMTNAPRDWPATGSLRLAGVTFSGLRGSPRDAQAWDEWLRRDPNFSPSPYAQFAAAFAAEGDGAQADEMRYLSRVREQEAQKGLSWLWSWFLRWVAGFGIGLYPFIVVYWILGISALGGAYLWAAVERRRTDGHGLWWCCGATLARLLPVIEINKEFSDYFDDPTQRAILRGWPTAVFSAIRLLGWLLAAILAAAVSGLTAKS